MAALEVIVLNRTITTSMTPVVIVRGINPRISRRWTLATPTPPAIPIHLVILIHPAILIPQEGAMAEAVRRKAGTIPLAVATAKSIITKSITMTITRPMALRG